MDLAVDDELGLGRVDLEVGIERMDVEVAGRDDQLMFVQLYPRLTGVLRIRKNVLTTLEMIRSIYTKFVSYVVSDIHSASYIPVNAATFSLRTTGSSKLRSAYSVTHLRFGGHRFFTIFFRTPSLSIFRKC